VAFGQSYDVHGDDFPCRSLHPGIGEVADFLYISSVFVPVGEIEKRIFGGLYVQTAQ